MIYPVFSIRDQKVAFSPEFFIQDNEQSMVRAFGFMINNTRNMMGYAPSDYDLYQIGSFNNETGELIPKIPIQFIVNGGSVFNEKSES